MVDYKHEGMAKFASDTGCLTGNMQAPALYKNMEVHPAEKLGAGAFADNERRYLQQLSIQYGSHMAMRTVIERNIFAQHQRLGGNGSAFALQSHMGKIYTLDETDIYNDPRDSPFTDKVGVHARVERIYGLWICQISLYTLALLPHEITKFQPKSQ